MAVALFETLKPWMFWSVLVLVGYCTSQDTRYWDNDVNTVNTENSFCNPVMLNEFYVSSVRELTSKLAVLEQSLNALNDKINALEMQLLSSSRPKTCSDVTSDGNVESGVFTVYPERLGSGVQVFCDMDTDGGGWTVFQRRFDGSLDFNRTWLTYKHGFGILTHEHWLGNEYIYAMTSSSDEMTLRIELEDWDGNTRYASYSNFRVGDESSRYLLTFDAYSGGSAGDAFGRNAKQNGTRFSTRDRDSDTLLDHNCASFDNGFWYSDCAYGSLNGPYCPGGSPYGSIIWNTAGNVWHPLHYCFRATKMMFRLEN